MTVVSFCLRCFATVGEAVGGEELAHFEQAHVCDPYDVARFHLKSRVLTIPSE